MMQLDDQAMADEAATGLLSRSSEETPLSMTESWSDYHDELGEAFYYKTKTPKLRKRRLKRYISALTHTPLGICARKSKSRKFRLFACLFNLFALIFFGCFMWALVDGVFRPSYSNPPKHYHDLAATVKASNEPGRGNPRGEKIFIASNIIQHEMIRGPWGASVLSLIDMLGPENVFVSIYENDSGPETVLALSWFREQLMCEHSIVYGDHLPLTDFPTVVIPNGETRVKRLTYLTEIRNRLLVPLDEPPKLNTREKTSANYTSTRFDRILFINDIYFNPEDALNLLFSTNINPETGISEYQGACGLDFIRGGTLYDSFVIRDLDGYEISWFLYPWFTTSGSAASRKDVIDQKDAVRVRSCWSGMAAYEATPFLRKEVVQMNPSPAHLYIPAALSANSTRSTDSTSSNLDHLVIRQDYPPLRFRHQSDLYWEASECCVLNADLLARYPGIETNMYVNPFIRVTYDAPSWGWQPWMQRFERSFAILQFIADKVGIGWEKNPRRNEVVGRPATVRKWVYDNPLLNGEHVRNATADAAVGLRFPLHPEQVQGSWRTVERVAEPGGFCGQRRLFVMLGDLQKANRGKTGKNWEKISQPKGLF